MTRSDIPPACFIKTPHSFVNSLPQDRAKRPLLLDHLARVWRKKGCCLQYKLIECFPPVELSSVSHRVSQRWNTMWWNEDASCHPRPGNFFLGFPTLVSSGAISRHRFEVDVQFEFSADNLSVASTFFASKYNYIHKSRKFKVLCFLDVLWPLEYVKIGLAFPFICVDFY